MSAAPISNVKQTHETLLQELKAHFMAGIQKIEHILQGNFINDAEKEVQDITVIVADQGKNPSDYIQAVTDGGKILQDVTNKK